MSKSFQNNVRYYLLLVLFFSALVGLNASTKSIVQDRIPLPDSIQQFRVMAKMYADSLNAEKAIDYAERYILATRDLSIINDHFFYKIENNNLYTNFRSSYKPRFNFLSLLYLFAAFLGVFVFMMLNLKRGIDRTSTFLISLFVLLHSLFILHLSLYLINYQYYFPSSLLMSTSFALLYGPLIYLYFKMTALDYKLKWKDGLHFVPALALLIYLAPLYGLSPDEKFAVLFEQQDILVLEAQFIIAAQVISLILYAYLTYNIYRAIEKKEKQNAVMGLWQRNIIAIYVTFTVAFIFYFLTTSGILDTPIFYHLQIIVMVCLVLYVAYISYVRPEIFKGEVRLADPIELFKYKKSSLTESFSEELKDQLVNLLIEDKVYKQNTLNLDVLSEMLGTTRHNTSQVINEHFDMNFYDLVNKFRIEEAVNIINDLNGEKKSLIEIAYEVGFNNKVTFNKSFKKIHNVTPTQYIKSIDQNS